MSLESVAKAYIEVELGFLEHMKEQLGANHIFVSYSKPSVQGPMFGNTPAVYWYATKRGDSRVPCFMHDGEASTSEIVKPDNAEKGKGLNYRKYVLVKKAVKFALVAILNLTAFAYLSGNYAIPYTLLAGRAVAQFGYESERDWQIFRDKYYENDKETPTWKEFNDAGNGTPNSIFQICAHLRIPVPAYVTSASKSFNHLLSVRDVKKDNAKELLAEGDRQLGIDPDKGNYEIGFNHYNFGHAMSAYVKAHELEPGSVEILARIAKVCLQMGHAETSMYWLIQANAAHMGMLR